MGIAEVDLRRNKNNSDDNNNNEMSTEQLLDKFKIEGYRIILPNSWIKHDKARIFVYVNDELNIKVINLKDNESHLQSIVIEVGFGRSKTHIFNYYYREWKSCVTGLNDLASQKSYLSGLVDIWRREVNKNKEVIFSGDMNLDAKLWDDPSYRLADLVNIVKDFMIEEECHQIIDDYTRIRQVNGTLQRSCLDHVIVNCINKIKNIQILGVGKSDHLGTLITKMSREIRTSPRTIKKRIYKNFNCDDFINDMKQAKLQGQFSEMDNTEDINIAGDIFTKVFTEVLDKHAPIKTIQNRTNYVPYITDDIKALMKERNILKIEATKTGSSQIFNNYKIKRNLVTTKLKDAKTKYYKSKFSENNLSPRELWSNVKTVLGNVRSQFPPQILLDNKLLFKPIEMATGMNEYFIKKIATLKTNTNIANEDAMKNLIDYVESHDLPNEGFKLKEISEETTIEIIKSLKGKKSIGSDWI